MSAPFWEKRWPRVIVMNTLIGGGDINRRSVYMRETGIDRPVAQVNADLRTWTPAHQRELDEIVLALEASP